MFLVTRWHFKTITQTFMFKTPNGHQNKITFESTFKNKLGSKIFNKLRNMWFSDKSYHKNRLMVKIPVKIQPNYYHK